MASDEKLVQRIRDLMVGRELVDERSMFGGKAFFHQSNMMVGVHKTYLICRIGKPAYDDVIDQDHVSEMDITGRAMKGWVKVAPEGIPTNEDLLRWIDLSEAFVQTLPAK